MAEGGFEKLEMVQELLRGDIEEKNLTCIYCFDDIESGKVMRLSNCASYMCLPCLKEICYTQVRSVKGIVYCVFCNSVIHPEVVRLYTTVETYKLYEYTQLRHALSKDSATRWCPQSDCTYAVIAINGEIFPNLECKRPGCNTNFCYNCNEKWHEFGRGCSTNCNDLAIADIPNTFRCPKCKLLLENMDKSACAHMICPKCCHNFCWRCLKPYFTGEHPFHHCEVPRHLRK